MKYLITFNATGDQEVIEASDDMSAFKKILSWQNMKVIKIITEEVV